MSIIHYKVEWTNFSKVWDESNSTRNNLIVVVRANLVPLILTRFSELAEPPNFGGTCKHRATNLNQTSFYFLNPRNH